MQNQAVALYRLQQVDLDILDREKRLKEIEAALTDRHTILQAEEQVENAKNQLAPLRTRARNLELEIQSNTEKSSTTEEQLYSGRVKNTKEMRDMQQEIQSLKKRNEELEDNLLELMMAVEEAEETLQHNQSQLEAITTGWEGQYKDLLTEKASLEEQLHKLRQKREKTLEPVTETSQSLYESLRKSKGNQPISLLDDGSCAVCGIVLTRAIEQAVRHGDLIQCSNCGRILADKPM